MLTFSEARKRHAILGRLVSNQNRELAEQIYAGVTGVGPSGTLIGNAVADTTPAEYVVLVTTDDIPAAFAATALLDAFQCQRAPSSPREARRIAEAGWQTFRELADQAGHVERGTDADMSAAWPKFEAYVEVRPDPAKMRAIGELAGRMLAALRGSRAKRVKEIPEEVVGVELGGRFERLLPAEYALLSTAPARAELFGRVLERRALQFERAGTDKKSRGPLVIVVDESSSMRQDGLYASERRDTWAKAAMTALTTIAWEKKRHVAVVRFSTATRVHRLPPGAYTELVRAQNEFLDGGTDICTALLVAAEQVDALKAEGRGDADVVLVSDGGNDRQTAHWLPGAVDAIAQRGARLWSVAIQAPFEGVLKDRAAAYVHLTQQDMRSPEGASKVGGAVL